MILNLSAQQMLEVWREVAGFQPLLSDCSVQAFDGIDIDRMITSLMRQWYLGLLDSATPEIIGPPSDAAGLISISADGDPTLPASMARLDVDHSVRRLFSLRLDSWERPADVLCADEVGSRLQTLDNPYTCPRIASPMAWRDRAGNFFISPVGTSSSVSWASAVIDPGPDSYIFDERAIALIPKNIPWS